MITCGKCGNQLDDAALFCGTCGTKLTMPTSETQTEQIESTASAVPEVTATESVAPVATVEPEVQPAPEAIETEQSDAADGKKKKKKTGELKSKIVSKGKDSILSFVIKKIVTSLFTAVLSAALVFFAQYKFKGDFKDYYKKTFLPISEDSKEIGEFVDQATNMTFEETVEYYEDNDIYEKTKDVLVRASKYSSDNKDVMKFHNAAIDVYEEILNLSTIIYSASTLEEDVSVEYQAALINMSIKLEIFEEVAEDLYKKYDIEPAE